MIAGVELDNVSIEIDGQALSAQINIAGMVHLPTLRHAEPRRGRRTQRVFVPWPISSSE
jgi:hypothetical protein